MSGHVTWEEMQDWGFRVHQPTTGRVLPTQSLRGLPRKRTLRSGRFVGAQGPVETRDPIGDPVQGASMNHDLAAIHEAIARGSGPNAAAGLGVTYLSLQGRGLGAFNRDRAGRICGATAAIGQVATTIGASQAQSGKEGWLTAQQVAGQTDELCSAMFGQPGTNQGSADHLSVNPAALPDALTLAQAQGQAGQAVIPTNGVPQGGGGGISFGSGENKTLLYVGGAVALGALLFLLK